MTSTSPAKIYRRAGSFLSRLQSASFRGALLDLLGGRVRFSAKAVAIAAASVFLLSFAIRSLGAADLYQIAYTKAMPGGGMSGDYSRAAVSALNGEGLLYPDNWDVEDTSLLMRPPGYPAFLAVIYSDKR